MAYVSPPLAWMPSTNGFSASGGDTYANLNSPQGDILTNGAASPNQRWVLKAGKTYFLECFFINGNANKQLWNETLNAAVPPESTVRLVAVQLAGVLL